MMKRNVVRYLMMIFGCVISSIGIDMFLIPAQLLSGGTSGIAMICYYIWGFPIGVQLIIMNIPLLILSYKLLGKNYTRDVVFCAIVFSASVDFFSFTTAYKPVSDPMISAIYGGILKGIGFGVMFRYKGSSAGFDIVAAIMKKYYAMDMGVAVFCINCLIVGSAGILFGLTPAMLTLISMYICAVLTDKIMSGFSRKKTLMIVSEAKEELAKLIINDIGRGITVFKAEGAYTHQPKDVLLVAVNPRQIAQIKDIVSKVDPMAFIIVQDAYEVMGRGFSLPGSKDLARLR